MAWQALALAALALAGGCSDGRGAEQDVGSSERITTEKRVAPAFDRDSAMTLLRRQVEFGPRVPGTEGHERQLAWMEAFLRERADTVVAQAFTHAGPSGETLHLTNVFARFRPDEPTRVLLLTHWDTRPTADNAEDPADRDRPIPGANDGASGTAVLMELANVLSSHSPPIGVDLLFVDGEDYAPDYMYLGAEYFAAHLAPGYEPLYGVLVDMVGDQNPLYPPEQYSQQYAPEVVDRVWRMAERLGFGAYFPGTPGMAIGDDHLKLIEAGIHTIDIIDFEYGPGNVYWHTLQDDLDHVAPTGLGVVGTTLAELIYRGG